MSVYWNQSAITSSLAVFGRGDVKDDDVKQLSKIEFPSGLTICYGIESISVVNRAIVADEITIAPSVFSIRDGFIPVDSKGMVTYKSYVFLNTKKVWVRGVSGYYAEEYAYKKNMSFIPIACDDIPYCICNESKIESPHHYRSSGTMALRKAD